ncbi:MAG: nucleoside recognition domain-containing protein [bacterium]
MLNYIWLSMIVIGILTAAGFDIYDEARNTNRNGMPLEANVEISKLENAIVEGEIVLPADRFNSFYGTSVSAEVRQPVTISTSEKSDRTFVLPVSDSTPKQWKAMAKGAAGKDRLSGDVRSFRISEDGKSAIVQIEFEQIRFVKMKAITQAALDIAGVAVTLALGLIGIMALWLGVMKVAEEAGLLKVVARILSPIMKRIFPDVPSDHPAVGAMIMNIAANMLGLNNAATPLGLKAMDELEKLNPKPGTATNAMVTFLAINTGGLILIPATAIAVRASVGSLNPGIIIGTSIVGAGCATVAGIIAAKLLQRLPRFKKDAEVANG